MHRMRKKEEKHHMILGIAVAAILLTAILVLSVRIQEVTVCKGPVSASQTDPVCRGL